MTKITDDMISNLYTIMDAPEGERIVHSKIFLNADEGTPERALYDITTHIASHSDISFAFSFTVMSKACDIVSQYLLDSDGNEDNISELVDNAVPVYNAELMQIYVADWWIVDEAQNEYGTEVTDSVQRAQSAWYYILDRITREIIDAVSEYNNAQ
jgi:hypothetical protein